MPPPERAAKYFNPGVDGALSWSPPALAERCRKEKRRRRPNGRYENHAVALADYWKQRLHQKYCSADSDAKSYI